MIRRIASLAWIALASSALARAGDAPRPLDVGLNISESGPGLPSADLAYAAEMPDWPHLQTTLAAPHVAGSGVFELANDRVCHRAAPYLGANSGPITLALLGDDGAIVRVKGWNIHGTPQFHVFSFEQGADQHWDAGTPIDRGDGWNNASTNPADRPLAPNLIVAGRDTGYPAGLKPGQSMGWGTLGAPTIQLPAGTYTFKAEGTGRARYGFRYRDGTPDETVTVDFAAGVATPATHAIASTELWFTTLDLTGSSPADPLWACKLILPGHAAAFAALASPFDTVYHPENLGYMRRGGIVRLMDIEGINFSRVVDWDARQVELHRRLIARVNAAGVDAWFCVPHLATDAYVRSFCAFIEANLAPGLRWYIEHSNEVWNGSFGQNFHAREAGAATGTPLRALAITSDGTTCAVHRPAHGMTTGTVAVIENATDDRFNGEYPVAVVDADHLAYAPTMPPPAGAAVARDRVAQPLLCFDPAAEGSATITSMAWNLTSTVDGSYIAHTTSGPHGIRGQEVDIITGCAQPQLNAVFRGDQYKQADGVSTPTTFYNFHGFAARDIALPDLAGTAPAAIAAAPGRTLRVTRLAGDANAANPHLMELAHTGDLWHALRSKEIFELAYAASRASAHPGRFGGGIFGLWAGSIGNAGQCDNLVAAHGGTLPTAYPVFHSTAPYFQIDDPDGVHDRDIVGDFLAIASITASGGVATATWNGATTVDHRAVALATGQPLNVVNVYPAAYCGPTTITVTGANTFTFPLPSGVTTLPDAVAMSNRYGMGGLPMPSHGREITAFTRSGDTFTLTSPRHGLAPGAVVHVGGFNYPQFDGQYTIQATTTDTVTIVRPGTTYTPTSPTDPANGYRPWIIADAIVQRTLDGIETYVDGHFRTLMVGAAAAEARAHGMIPVVYEFSNGTQPEGMGRFLFVEPANLTYQAANRTARMGDLYRDAFSWMYGAGFALAMHYGDYGTFSAFGNYPAEEWQGQHGYRYQAIEDARARYGHAEDAGPSFDVTPTKGETGSPINFAAKGVGTNWSATSTAAVAGTGVTGDILEFAVTGATSATGRLKPGAASGDLFLSIDGVSRPLVVYPAPTRRLWLDTTSPRKGETRTNVPITGFNTAFTQTPTFTLTGGRVSDVVVIDDGHATATITAPDAFGPVTLADGLGATATIPVVVEVVVDDADVGCTVAGGWFATTGGLGDNRRYRRGNDAGASIAWTMAAPVAGLWSYQVDFPGGGAADATYTVLKNGSVVATVTADQSRPSIGAAAAGDALFQPLGSIALAAGDTLAVRLEGRAGSGGYLLADACRFVTQGDAAFPPDLIVDDVEGRGYSRTGSWNPVGGGLGGGARYANGQDAVAATATWTARAPEAGIYEVSASWHGGASNSIEAPYRLLVDGVAQGAAVVDQRTASIGDVRVAPGIGLQYLGTIVATAPGQVLGLELTGRGGVFVIADAARFRAVAAPVVIPAIDPPPPPPPPPTEADLIRSRLDAIEARQARTEAILDRIRAALTPVNPDGGAGPRP